jgi:hypothetical protein
MRATSKHLRWWWWEWALRWTPSDVEAKSMSKPDFDQATTAIVIVGEGRGFVVEAEDNRFVITAGHCLPFVPPCAPFSYTEERTYPNLLGPLGSTTPTVWAECCFVDPVADVAVLGEPDNQALSDQSAAYNDFVEQAVPLPVSDLLDPTHYELGWLLSLQCEWFQCSVGHDGRGLWVREATKGIVGGMSGSPILAEDGRAVGVVSTAGERDEDEQYTEGGPNPRLAVHLPGWLLRELLKPD